MSNETDKRTATQRIEDLEKVVSMLYQSGVQTQSTLQGLLGLQRDMAIVRDALKILNKRTEATIQVAKPETGISVDSVSALVVQMNVQDLTAQIASLIQSGNLVATDSVASDSYLVGEELAADGSLANPRIQFPVNSQDAATSEALLGKKAGDVVSFGPDKLSLKIQEVYSMVEPKAAEAVESSVESTPAAEVASSSAPESNSSQALDSLPAETPVTQFVSDAGSVAATA